MDVDNFLQQEQSLSETSSSSSLLKEENKKFGVPVEIYQNHIGKKKLWERVQTTPYGRLKNESSMAFEAFTFYVSFPVQERSVLYAYRVFSGDLHARTAKRWYGWQTKNLWKLRAQIYDEVIQYTLRSGTLRYNDEIAKRHLLLARLIQEKASKAIESIDPKALAKMPQVALRFATEGIKLERTILDQPTDIKEQVLRLSPNEVEAAIYAELEKLAYAGINTRPGDLDSGGEESFIIEVEAKEPEPGDRES